MPFTHYRTQGIFLKKEDRGEADQLFTIFTKDYGKLEILGKAIRKIKSKLRSGAELFYLSEIEFIQGKTYKTLTDAILIEKFKKLRENLEKLEISYKIADALDSLTGKEEKDDKIWHLLKGTFQRLNNCKLKIENWELKIMYYFFLWNLFSLLGFQPELYSCPVCGKKLLPETFWFLPSEGGVVCWRCFKKYREAQKKEAREISVDTVKILRIFLEKDWDFVKKIKLEKETIKNLEEISQLYLEYLRAEFSKLKK
jgi:DNA repair protein RecO (recombination protein O)